VLNNGQVRFVIENLIQDIRGIVEGGGDDFGAILRELIAALTIEGNAFAIAKVSRERAGVTHLAPHRKALAIRGRQRSTTPMLRQGLAILKVHEGGNRRLQRFFSHSGFQLDDKP
jgi:hypothetical protein